MTVYEYESFDTKKMREIIGDKVPTEALVNQYIQAVKYPDPREYLEHQYCQFKCAIEAGCTDDRWSRLKDRTKDADLALQSGNIALICACFAKVGAVGESLHHPSSSENLELMKTKLSDMKRQIPIQINNSHKLFLQKVARKIAEKKWNEDSVKNMRITEMCGHVWRELVDVATTYEIYDLLPDNEASIKEWIKPIAPAYAKKGGRPKNIKK